MARYPLVISAMLLLSLFTMVEVQNELELEPIQERIIGDQSIGGIHLATGDWWEPQRLFQVGIDDMDGDGVLDYLDPYPGDPAVPWTGDLMGSSCANEMRICITDPTSAPFALLADAVSSQGSSANAVEWGDIDGDGDLDLAVGNNGAPNVVYLNDGVKITDEIAWTSPYSLVTTDLAWGDLDNDGDLDLAVANYEAASFVFLNEGGVLSDTPYWSYLESGDASQARATGIDLGDIDGDGDLDIVLSIVNKGSKMFRNQGSYIQSFAAWTGQTGKLSMDVELADFDGDGDLDLAEAVSNDKNKIYSNTGSTFGPIIWQSTNVNSTRSLTSGDIDGDGRIDLVVANHADRNMLYLNTGSGFSTNPDWTSADENDTFKIRLADVDRDGDLDMLEANAQQPDVIRTFTDNDLFGDAPTWMSQNHGDTSDAVWGDIDGDGDLDIAFADGNDGPTILKHGGAMLSSSVDWNDGQSHYNYGMDLGDFDNDGDLDLLTAMTGDSSYVWMIYSYDNGNYAFHEGGNHQSCNEWSSALWIDLNGNNNLDLLLGDKDCKNYGVEIDGDYSASNNQWTSTTNDYTQDLLKGDVNGDGLDDLIVMNWGYNRIHFADSTTGIPKSASFSFNDYSDSTCGALADIDLDGDLDLFVANYEERDQIFLNYGSGFSTTPAWTSNTNSDAQGCDLGDVNGDGYPDLVIGIEDKENHLYLNNGGSFPTTPSWTTAESDDTMTILLRDVDSDGDLDIVEGSYSGKNLIRMNNGIDFNTNIWESPDILDTWELQVADVNGDGSLDMVTINEQQTNQLFLGSPDQDGDWVPEPEDQMPNDPTQTSDQDGDGHGDNPNGMRPDSCSGYWGDSWRDRWGCPDLDQDGQSDLLDPFMQKDTQWSDIDLDGWGDNWNNVSLNLSREERGIGIWVKNAHLPDPSPWDYDNDGFEDENLQPLGAHAPFDDCPLESGTSFRDRKGCVDADRDGMSDAGDAFPGDATQWADSDDDGYGDNSKGLQPDSCPELEGNSTIDRFGCPDADGDGWSDDKDMEPDDGEVWSDDDRDGFNDQVKDDCVGERGFSFRDRKGCKDSDGDGWSDPDADSDAHPDGSADAFADDESQWRDNDDDGFGDNLTGNNPDRCSNSSGSSSHRIDDAKRVIWLGCPDSDGDGLEDESDACPINPGFSTLDRWGCPDADSDGVSDALDDCDIQPGDSTIGLIACPDSDGDGIPDSLDPIDDDGLGQEYDWDADGWPNPIDEDNVLEGEDAFPSDPSQWADSDGDGLGDNANGNSPDPYLNDFDNDGVDDENDAFPQDPREWNDNDGDGIGDNADSDDDNDGYSDIAELNALTDPLNSLDHPIESWEIVIPGTEIGLGAWDVVGMFGGIPLALWLGFGILTRGGRSRRFEGQLKEAKTRLELEEVAGRYEFSLMLRLIGPHQGIRLERLRAELDDELEDLAAEMKEMFAGDVIETGPPAGSSGVIDEEGYEWLEYQGMQWFRKPGSTYWALWQPTD